MHLYKGAFIANKTCKIKKKIIIINSLELFHLDLTYLESENRIPKEFLTHSGLQSINFVQNNLL